MIQGVLHLLVHTHSPVRMPLLEGERAPIGAIVTASETYDSAVRTIVIYHPLELSMSTIVC